MRANVDEGFARCTDAKLDSDCGASPEITRMPSQNGFPGQRRLRRGKTTSYITTLHHARFRAAKNDSAPPVVDGLHVVAENLNPAKTRATELARRHGVLRPRRVFSTNVW